MKLKILFLVFVLHLSFGTGLARAEESNGSFSFSHTDHQLHMLSTYGLSTTFSALLISRKVPRWKAVLISSLSTIALAYGKEKWVDPFYTDSDMVANSIGVAASALVVISFGF